jgi:Carboxypeptidase regulatory-like domain
MAASFCSAQTNSTPAPDSETGIEGVITLGPVHGGPIRPGIPSSRPLANASFVVTNKTREVATFTTDGQGKFHVALAPGHYTVSMKNKKGHIGHYGPFEVDVVAGKTTGVSWECDTGIR